MKENNRVTEQILARNYAIISQNVDDQQYTYYLENASYLSRESFYILYRNYFILLEQYLANRLPLEKYEKRIAKSLFRFSPVKGSKFFQGQLSTLGLRYFKLIAFPTLHLLEENDISSLLALNKEKLSEPDSTLLGIVDRTYVSVLDCGPSSSVIQFVNHMNHDLVRSVVFEFSYDEFKRSILGTGKLWEMMWIAKSQFLAKVFIEMEQEFSRILGVKVQITL